MAFKCGTLYTGKIVCIYETTTAKQNSALCIRDKISDHARNGMTDRCDTFIPVVCVLSLCFVEFGLIKFAEINCITVLCVILTLYC